MKESKCNAIILHTKPMFEKDKIVEIFSPTLGKRRVLAKRANSQRTSLTGKLEPSHHVQMNLYKGKSFDIITEIAIIDHFHHIRTSFNHMSMLFYIIETIRKSTTLEQENDRLFSLLLTTCQAINNDAKDAQSALFSIRDKFHHHFLEIEGLLDQIKTSTCPQSFKRAFESYTGYQLPQPIFFRT